MLPVSLKILQVKSNIFIPTFQYLTSKLKFQTYTIILTDYLIFIRLIFVFSETIVTQYRGFIAPILLYLYPQIGRASCRERVSEAV